MDLISQLKARGFVHQITDEEALRSALSGGPVTFYCGFDPTAPSLHAGSLVQLMLMGNLARAGHRTIGVIGGGTGRIGDPAGRDTARDLLSEEKIAENLRGIRAQIERFCPGVEMIDNAEWLLGLNYISFLRDIGRHFSVNRMISAESVRLRLEREQGLSFIEFNYMLLQAYDFLELYRRHGCRLQIGGQDQWFNILMGAELIRRVEGAESFGLTTPLLATASGAKMGKTAAGAVWLDPERVPPFEYYQYWYNCDDRDLDRFFKLFTFLPLPEIAEILRGAEDVRAAKHRLAREVCAIAHGDRAAAEAQEAAYGLFGRPGVARVFTATEETPRHAAALPRGVLDLLAESGLCRSKAEARQKIREGAVKIHADRQPVDSDRLQIAAPTLLWVGKKQVVQLISAPAPAEIPAEILAEVPAGSADGS